MFIFAFAESSFFPIPPDVLLIALCIGATAKSFRFAAICQAGSIVGAMAGYGIGYFLWQSPSGEYTALANFFFDHVFSVESFDKVSELYNRYNFWIHPAALQTVHDYGRIVPYRFRDVHHRVDSFAGIAFLPVRCIDMEIRRSDKDVHRQIFQYPCNSVYGDSYRLVYSGRQTGLVQ